MILNRIEAKQEFSSSVLSCVQFYHLSQAGSLFLVLVSLSTTKSMEKLMQHDLQALIQGDS
jgi:hypothetical protein